LAIYDFIIIIRKLNNFRYFNYRCCRLELKTSQGQAKPKHLIVNNGPDLNHEDKIFVSKKSR
jgi:hypothetical protein